METIVPFPNPQADTYSLNLFGYDASKMTINPLISGSSMSFNKGYNIINGNIDRQFKTIEGESIFTLIDKTNSYNIDRINGSSRYTTHVGTGKVKNLVGSSVVNIVSKDSGIDESRALATQISYASDKQAKKLIGGSGYISPRGGSGQIDRIMAIEAVTGTNKAIVSNSSILKIDNINSNIELHSNYGGNIGSIKGLNIEYNIESGISDDRITNNYGIYVNDVSKGQNKYSIYTNAGQVRVGDLAQSGAGDRVVYADENGILKTGVVAATPAVEVGSTTSMKCDDANRGKMNFVKDIDLGDGKTADAFAVCLKGSDDNHYWRYLYGGAGIHNGTDTFGKGLK